MSSETASRRRNLNPVAEESAERRVRTRRNSEAAAVAPEVPEEDRDGSSGSMGRLSPAGSAPNLPTGGQAAASAIPGSG